MDDQELYETIEAYLLQRLSLEETQAFEARLRTDAVLAQQVSRQRIAIAALDRLTEQGMAEKFARWRTEQDTSSDTLPRPSFFATYNRWFLAAAALLLLAVAFWFLKDSRQTGSDENKVQGKETPTLLPTDSVPIDPGAKQPPSIPPSDTARPIAALAEPDLDQYGKKLSGGLRGGNQPAASTEEMLLRQSDSLLAAKKYKSALRLLQQIPAGDFDLSKHARLFFVYHKLGQHARAIEAYQQYAALDPSNEEQHDWYRCLLYLADHPRHEKAFQRTLKKITDNPNHSYHKRALVLQKAVVNNDE